MKYANQINAMLAVLGVATALYALSQTYFNPEAQPQVVVDMGPLDESETPSPDRGSGQNPTSLIGTGVVGVPPQGQRPSRTRTRPANTRRENSAPTPGGDSPRREFRSPGAGAAASRGAVIPNRPITRTRPTGRRDQEADAVDEDTEQAPARPLLAPGRSGRRPPAGQAGFQQPPEDDAPETAPQQPEKRESAPPPPARSSMPGS